MTQIVRYKKQKGWLQVSAASGWIEFKKTKKDQKEDKIQVKKRRKNDTKCEI